MYMGVVVGSVVATQKATSLVGKKLMIVQPINSKGEPVRFEEVASDTVGAGIGEKVLFVRGAAAHRSFAKTPNAENDVTDASIVAIIDQFDK
ncbi:EutN/CcmL family microcompartment protein [Lentilactobacillus senioris]|uniref:EutN/CcmL family microcompartment protein n=1 Tax=Lentilactobacillus senioris TaxID=931534 RepID=UPI003D299F85